MKPYPKRFVDACAADVPTTWKKSPLDFFFAMVPDFGQDGINGDPVPEEDAHTLVESLNFGWWDSHHQVAGPYQLMKEQ